MMKFNPRITVRNVADEHIVMRMGPTEADLTTVMALNETSMLIYNHFGTNPFTADDVVALLCEEFDVDQATACNDVASWVGDMRKEGLIVDA